MKILALGPAGTNGHEAAKFILDRWNNSGVQIEFCNRNVDIPNGVLDQRCYGIAPIENATAGLVNEIIRDFWLAKSRGYDLQGHESKSADFVSESCVPGVYVIGEISLQVEHCLLVNSKINGLDEITSVISHPQALEQCRDSLNRLGITSQSPTKSTAGAALMVAEDEYFEHVAAIASKFAAKCHGLKIMQEHLEDFPGNGTRFHLLGPNPEPPTGKDRTAMLFWLADKPRALLNTLWCFGTEEVNMSSIHSIPLGSPGQYAFYCEFDCHLSSEVGKNVLKRMRTVANKIVVLGSYPR